MAHVTINGNGFTLIKSNKMVEWFKAYNYSNDYCLNNVYGTCSSAKHRAENNIKDFMADMGKNGFECEGYRIITFSTTAFTVGYTLKNEDGIKFFIVETANNRYCCPWKWLEQNC